MPGLNRHGGVVGLNGLLVTLGAMQNPPSLQVILGDSRCGFACFQVNCPVQISQGRLVILLQQENASTGAIKQSKTWRFLDGLIELLHGFVQLLLLHESLGQVDITLVPFRMYLVCATQVLNRFNRPPLTNPGDATVDMESVSGRLRQSTPKGSVKVFLRLDELVNLGPRGSSQEIEPWEVGPPAQTGRQPSHRQFGPLGLHQAKR